VPVLQSVDQADRSSRCGDPRTRIMWRLASATGLYGGVGAVFVASAPLEASATTIPVSGCRSGSRRVPPGGRMPVQYVERVIIEDCDRGSRWACDELQRPARHRQRTSNAGGLPDRLERQQRSDQGCEPRRARSPRVPRGWPGACGPDAR
jgi:hypothetical protein